MVEAKINNIISLAPICIITDFPNFKYSESKVKLENKSNFTIKLKI